MTPRLILGADTLCWHTRLEAGELSLDDLLAEAAGAGAEFVQLSLHHARALDAKGLASFAARAQGEGLRLLASGDFVGSVTKGAQISDGQVRVERWLEQASVIGSPILRVASGFYRAELAGRPDLIAAEREHVTAVLLASFDRAAELGVRVLLENHSDFSSSEYVQILQDVGSHRAGVFLDLINPISSFEDPLPVVEQLAPFAGAGHVKDYSLESDYVDDGYHRRGFNVRWRYPGEGVADLPALLTALLARTEGEFHLSVEGLDNWPGQADQPARLTASIRHVRALAERHTEGAVT